MPLGTNVFCVTLNLAASAHQTDLIQQLKSRGDDAIQTSSGLCVKTAMSSDELDKFVSEIAGMELKSEKIDQATDSSALTPDVKAFLG